MPDTATTSKIHLSTRSEGIESLARALTYFFDEVEEFALAYRPKHGFLVGSGPVISADCPDFPWVIHHGPSTVAQSIMAVFNRLSIAEKQIINPAARVDPENPEIDGWSAADLVLTGKTTGEDYAVLHIVPDWV